MGHKFTSSDLQLPLRMEKTHWFINWGEIAQVSFKFSSFLPVLYIQVIFVRLDIQGGLDSAWSMLSIFQDSIYPKAWREFVNYDWSSYKQLNLIPRESLDFFLAPFHTNNNSGFYGSFCPIKVMWQLSLLQK